MNTHTHTLQEEQLIQGKGRGTVRFGGKSNRECKHKQAAIHWPDKRVGHILLFTLQTAGVGKFQPTFHFQKPFIRYLLQEQSTPPLPLAAQRMRRKKRRWHGERKIETVRI